MDKEYFVPSEAQMTTIVLPTIIFCIGMVVAMLIGINKCKDWDIEKIGEIRRTRRVIQRITARLKERNFKTIEKARKVRQQAAAVAKAQARSASISVKKSEVSPPLYSSQQHECGTSPPPTYEDALLDEYYFELRPSTSRSSHSINSTSTTRRTSVVHKRTKKVRRVSRVKSVPPV